MQTHQGLPDETTRQNVRNSIGSIEAAIANCEMDVRQLAGEFSRLAEYGSSELEMGARVDVGRRAVKMQALLPRLQALLEKLKAAAGPKAMDVAETPVVFHR